MDDEPDLIADVRRVLRSGEPLDLLACVSSLMRAVDPRVQDPFSRDDDSDGLPSLVELVDTFIDVESVETTALLTGIGALTDDDLLRRRIAREVGRRSHALPLWLERLDDFEVSGSREMVHILGDGDNVILGVRLAGGHELTVVVYIDHNMGTLVKDAYVLPDPLDSFLDFVRATADADTEVRPLPTRDAKVRINEAIRTGAMTYPPFETDTWPACRAIVEWVVRRLPDGGREYERPEWSDDERQTLADRFCASEVGRPFDDADHRGLLESVLWFGCDYGPGDPLRWSPVAVEIVMLDWFPRKVVADAEYLSKLPELLAAFVEFCHAERGVPAPLTGETLAAVGQFLPEYLRTIRSPRPQGPAALLAKMGVLDPDGPWGEDDRFDDPLDDVAWRRSILTDAVGETALDDLDDTPLPDEAFVWDGIPDDVRAKVDEVRVACDGFCDEVLDTEYRTACRRLLARAAAGDPSVFRRKGRTATAAAAVCWTIVKANEVASWAGGAVQVKDLLAHFGLTGSVSQRANTLLKAAGIEHYYGDVKLCSPDYLVSTRRRRIIELRDQWLDIT